MKNVYATIIIAIICAGIAFIGSADAQSSIITTAGSHGFKPVAVPALTIATATPTIIGVMPPSCRSITVTASGATMFYGDENVCTTGLYPHIETGKSVTFTDISVRQPTIYFRALATATGKIGITAN